MQEIGEIAKNYKCTDKNGKEKQMDIKVIPNNMKKYMPFMFGKHF